jgi:hypothetical protein
VFYLGSLKYLRSWFDTVLQLQGKQRQEKRMCSQSWTGYEGKDNGFCSDDAAKASDIAVYGDCYEASQAIGPFYSATLFERVMDILDRYHPSEL